MNVDGDTTLPIYAEVGQDVRTSIQQLLASGEGRISFPVTAWPTRFCGAKGDGDEESVTIHRGVIRSFFEAIEDKNRDVVRMMIENALVTPETTDHLGATPLLVAVHHGDIRMVQCLVDFGAEVDKFGDYQGFCRKVHDVYRTPLQVAASTGNLALVRLFVEVFKADDSIIAPDGELALRLAANNGHNDVVNYLPSRRGGGWLRWKTHHARAVDRIKTAFRRMVDFVKFFAWHVPKFLLWSLPKGFFLYAKRKVTWCWKNRHRFGPWCKKQARELLQRVRKAIDNVGMGLKFFFVIILPRKLKELRTYIPILLANILKWIKESATTVANSVAHIFQRAASLLHSVYVAFVSFFRTVTLRDIWNGLCDVLHSIFVQFPQNLRLVVKDLPEKIWRMTLILLGDLGAVLWCIGWLLFKAVTWLPKELIIIVSGVGGSIAKGCHEILVWVDPKR